MNWPVSPLHSFNICACSIYPSSAGFVEDLYLYDPSTTAWAELFAAAQPTARVVHGFTSMWDKLYVHGGYGNSGERHAV